MTNLKRIRQEKGLSQSQLATKSNVSYQMIQKYEQKVKNINKASVTTVVALADALGCEVKELMEDES